MTNVVGWIDLDDEDDKALIDVDFRDAPADDSVLATYLASAYTQCVEYLPHTRDPQTCELVLEEPDTIPRTWVQAQVLQAAGLYRATIASGSSGQAGIDGQAITLYPMDWQVRNLLRPRRIGRFA